MKLSFKKSILLFTTVALGTMLGAAQDTETNEITLVEGYTFEREWKSEAVPKVNSSNPWSSYRQGFGQDNQFYIQNKSGNGTVMIYNKDGKVSDFFTNSGQGSNFTKDEAGNLIVRTRPYQDPYYNPNVFDPDFDEYEDIRLIKADGSTSTLLRLPDDNPGTRGDYWGFAEGDVFSTEGGRLVFVGRNTKFLYVLDINSGALTRGTRITMPFMPGPNGDKDFAFEDVVNAWKDANGNQHYLVVQRTENPIDVIINNDYTATAKTINIMSFSDRGTSNGTNAFAFNGKNYIMFSTQPNWNDGFAIAELGTNDDGSLNGTINVVAQHVTDYSSALSTANSPSCNWLNWEPRDEKSIYVYQYFPGYYMARYIFGLETDTTTLADIVNDGEVGESYTVADDILGVYIAVKDPKCVYAKDLGKHRNPSVKKASEIDFVANQVDDNNVKLQPDEWDQSNWVLLQFESVEDALKFAGKKGEPGSRPIACKVIKGGTLTGTLTSKLNPTMTVTAYEEPTETQETQDYVENNYLPCNFMTPNVQSNIFYHGVTGDYFFIEPKAQEYVKVWWATYDGNDHFSVRTSSQFKGSFNVNWSLYPGDYTKDFVKDTGYSFHAIVRYVTPSEQVQPLYPKADYSDMVKEGNYMVFPLEGGADVVTGIENVHADLGNVLSVTYVNMLGIESPTPFSGINIVVTKYENGTRITKSMK